MPGKRISGTTKKPIRKSSVSGVLRSRVTQAVPKARSGGIGDTRNPAMSDAQDQREQTAWTPVIARCLRNPSRNSGR